jgi:hypothetical protein
LPPEGFTLTRTGRPIPFVELDLEQPWKSLDISHELTSKGIAKFVADYRKTVAKLVVWPSNPLWRIPT